MRLGEVRVVGNLQDASYRRDSFWDDGLRIVKMDAVRKPGEGA